MLKTKKRSYAFILYPESCNPNFEEVLKNSGHNLFYILHDKDVNVGDGGECLPKKPHVHVMVMFNNPRSDKAVKELCLQCGGNGYLEDIASTKGYARYLTHKDEKYKYHYPDEDVVVVGSFEYSKMCATAEDKAAKLDSMLVDIIRYCDENNIMAYCQLVDYCVAHQRDWLSVLRGRSGQLVSSYIKSKYWMRGLR